MDNNLLQIIGLGIAAGGLILAVKSFDRELNTIDKKGLTLASGITLIGLGAAVITRFKDTENRARVLFR